MALPWSWALGWVPADQTSCSHPKLWTWWPQAEGEKSQRALPALFFPQFQSFPCWQPTCLFNEPVVPVCTGIFNRER